MFLRCFKTRRKRNSGMKDWSCYINVLQFFSKKKRVGRLMFHNFFLLSIFFGMYHFSCFVEGTRIFLLHQSITLLLSSLQKQILVTLIYYNFFPPTIFSEKHWWWTNNQRKKRTRLVALDLEKNMDEYNEFSDLIFL